MRLLRRLLPLMHVLACSEVKFAVWGCTAVVCYRRSLPEKPNSSPEEAAKAGVMVLIAGGDVVRFAPALNVSDEEIATGSDRFAWRANAFRRGASWGIRRNRTCGYRRADATCRQNGRRHNLATGK